MFIGFVLLVSICGMDVCEVLFVIDDVYVICYECMVVVVCIY